MIPWILTPVKEMQAHSDFNDSHTSKTDSKQIRILKMFTQVKARRFQAQRDSKDSHTGGGYAFPSTYNDFVDIHLLRDIKHILILWYSSPVE